jgi:hypothetical protein
MSTQEDLFQSAPEVPPKGNYRVHFTRLERVASESRGTMFRLHAQLVGGRWEGYPAYKMLTDDLKGVEWLEKAVTTLVRWNRVPKDQPRRDGLATAMIGCIALVSTYWYQHATEGPFLTIRNVLRPIG